VTTRAGLSRPYDVLLVSSPGVPGAIGSCSSTSLSTSENSREACWGSEIASGAQLALIEGRALLGGATPG